MYSDDLRCSTNFRVGAVPPYNFGLTVRKPAGWSLLTPFEIFEENTLWSPVRISSGEMLGLKLKSVGTVKKPEVLCNIFSHQKLDVERKRNLSSLISWMLSLREDIRPFYALGRHDLLVKALVEDLYGMRRTRRPDIFPMLILAVTLQMAPIKRSDQMMNLLIKEYGEMVRFDHKQISYWPSPERIAAVSANELRERCKLGYRSQILKDIADIVSHGFPTLQALEKMSAEDARAKLMELKGVGEYSADIITPHPGFALDVWSSKIFSLLLFGKRAESPRNVISELKKLAEEKWGKWRGYVFTYVLNDIQNLSRRFNLKLTDL
jgi:3-methyladenine DNA glycosylase/8-oxoguanine DNA glycosylase